MKKPGKNFVRMQSEGRIRVQHRTKTGGVRNVNVAGWYLVYLDGRKVGPMSYVEARSTLKVEQAKPVETIDFTKVNHDVNGNPRYVCHFLSLNTQAELDAEPWIPVSQKYALAVLRARRIGGRKFHNKQYGGGIVFQSYSLGELCRYISKLTGRHQIPDQT